MLKKELIKCCLILILLFVVYSTKAQNITGNWKGYLVESDFRQYEQRYNLEIVFEQLPMDVVKCVIKVFKKKSFQSTSEGIGIYDRKLNSILFSETKFITIADSSNPENCFMACHLYYNKMGNETLTGIFRTRKDVNNYCSEGKVYLRKFLPKEEKIKIREKRKEKRIIRKQRKKLIKESK